MISPLLIARKENAGILLKICAELGAAPREMIGDDWSLELFLKSDLKNYLFQSHYVLDVSAFTEKDNEFISLVEGITYQKDDANIIIYADGYYEGDNFLNEFIRRGITNIVANYSGVDESTNVEMMREDLKECLQDGLSKQKWRRFDKSFDAFAEAREAAAKAEKEQSRPRYQSSVLHIAVVGAQSRIGATTFALRLAKYFQNRDGDSVVVCAHQRGIPQLEMMKDMFDDSEETGAEIFSVNGIDICTSDADPQKNYNAEIYDFGNTPASDLNFAGFDKIYLVGGTSWNELPMIYSAQLPLNSINYTVALNFSDSAAIEKYRELLSVNLNDVIHIPFEPDPFVITDEFNELFDREFEQWSDEQNHHEDSIEK